METFDHSAAAGGAVEVLGNGLKTAFPGRAAEVTKSDATTFSVPSAIYVGGTGDVVVTPWDTSAPGPITFTSFPAGQVLPVMVRQVLDATTATDMIRVW